MAGKPILHLGARVECDHKGSAVPLLPPVPPAPPPSSLVGPPLLAPPAPNGRVLVDGKPVVLEPAPYVIAGCSVPPPPAGNGCVTGTWLPGVGAGRVRCGGIPVLLSTSEGVCVASGGKLKPVEQQVQSRVFGQ